MKFNVKKEGDNMLSSMIFIGNGFDVAHGYKTGYNDFYNNCDELKKLATSGNLLCKHILDNIKGDLWQDLECGLYEYSKMLTAQNGEGDKLSAERFKKEFKELRSAMFFYIKKVIGESVSGNPGYSVGKLSEEWMRLECQIVSFNYSHIVAAYSSDAHLHSYGLSFNADKLIYQHGSSYNADRGWDNTADSIVLGIDENQKVEKSHSFLYKSIQNVYNVNELIHSIDNKDVYIVYGCSMGASDAFYFKELFGKNKKNKIFIIYGYKDEAMDLIKENIIEYTGGINPFKADNNNEVFFIDSSKMDALQKTKEAIDMALNRDFIK